jgi:hypothetical protein
METDGGILNPMIKTRNVFSELFSSALFTPGAK